MKRDYGETRKYRLRTLLQFSNPLPAQQRSSWLVNSQLMTDHWQDSEQVCLFSLPKINIDNDFPGCTQFLCFFENHCPQQDLDFLMWRTWNPRFSVGVWIFGFCEGILGNLDFSQDTGNLTIGFQHCSPATSTTGCWWLNFPFTKRIFLQGCKFSMQILNTLYNNYYTCNQNGKSQIVKEKLDLLCNTFLAWNYKKISFSPVRVMLAVFTLSGHFT